MNDLQVSVASAVHAGTSTASHATIPALRSDGPPVDPRTVVEPGTGLRVAAAYFAALLGILFLAATTMGVGLLLVLFAPVADFFLRNRTMARLRGSSLRVGPQQLPQLWRCAEQYAQRLGMKTTPEVYIVESSSLNAFAMKVGSRHVITIIDDVVWGCLQSGNTQGIAFILAHEMAHHALGHTRGLRGYLTKAFLPLARIDEFTADNVATLLVGNRQTAVHALTMLLAGPQLLPYVNLQDLVRQASESFHDKYTTRAERGASHPLMLRRIHKISTAPQ